jgi:NAD+ synthase (glutamine-hydrolysing)
MKRILLTAASINTTPLDFSGNWEIHNRVLQSELGKKSDLIVFPELSLSGYGCEDSFYFPWVWERSFASLKKLAGIVSDQLVIAGLPFLFQSRLYNTVAYLSQGKILGIVPKQNLANTGIHYEKRWFAEWKGGAVLVSDLDLQPPPSSLDPFWFGEFLLNWNGVRIGTEICEDSWAVERPSHRFSRSGADVIACPGASHFAMGKMETRSRIFIESSRAQSNIYVFSNLVGNESGRAIFDGGNLISGGGEVYSVGERFGLDSFQLTSAHMNLNKFRGDRAKFFRNEISDHERIQEVFVSEDRDSDFLKQSGFSADRFKNRGPDSEPVQVSFQENQFESFTKALVLGLFDYLKKSKMSGYTLSLSGGADSASLAILVKRMQDEIIKKFGREEILSQFQKLPLLTTIYQKTENNSEITQEIAKKLAEECGAEHFEISIDSEIQGILSKMESTLGRIITWEKDGLALQNIQARVRSPIVWLLANLNRDLLLSTGNRSEAAVGYTTMDGDSSGSIAPIAGVSKKFILEWLHWVQQGGDQGFPDLPSLDLLLSTKPSAELKPLTEAQEDEKDLMPYPILQAIESFFIRESLDPSEIPLALSSRFTEYSLHELKTMVERFLHLFQISQWKRERLPISFHLDVYGLDPKTSFRYPVLSGKIPSTLPNQDKI